MPDPDVYVLIPPRTLQAIERYVKERIAGGDFLRSVLTNDLLGATRHADSENLAALVAIVRFLYNEVPSECWGSREAYEAWLHPQEQVGGDACSFHQVLGLDRPDATRTANLDRAVRDMVISHNGHPLVLLKVSEFALPEGVLDWYGKKYAFERQALSYTYVETAECPLPASQT